MSHNKNTPFIPLSTEITVKKASDGPGKIDFVSPLKTPNWNSHKKLIFRCKFIQTSFKNYESLWFKKTRLCALPNFGNLHSSTLASLRIGEVLASLANFGNWRSHLFYATC